MTDQEFPAGHVFFRPGEPGDRAYLLTQGQVEILAGPPDDLKRITLFDSGDVFGEMALIEERPRAFTARAVTAGVASAMSREEFEHQLINNPIHARRYLRSLFERLRSLTARVSGDAYLAQPTPPADQAPEEFAPSQGTETGWSVVLHPLTRKAAETLPEAGLKVTRFPLRIGRAASVHELEPLDLNDLWLLDEKPFNISRNHCEIQVDSSGAMVRDRGSHLGCIVNDDWIGGHASMGYARLEPGENVLIVGGRMSPYQFRVTVTHDHG